MPLTGSKLLFPAGKKRIVGNPSACKNICTTINNKVSLPLCLEFSSNDHNIYVMLLT